MDEIEMLFRKYLRRAVEAEKGRLRKLARAGRKAHVGKGGYLVLEGEVRNCTYPSIMPMALKRQANDGGFSAMACATLAGEMAEVIEALDRSVKLEMAMKPATWLLRTKEQRERDTMHYGHARARIKSGMEFFSGKPTMMRFWCDVAGLDHAFVADTAEKDLEIARQWYELFRNTDRNVEYRLTRLAA